MTVEFRMIKLISKDMFNTRNGKTFIVNSDEKIKVGDRVEIDGNMYAVKQIIMKTKPHRDNDIALVVNQNGRIFMSEKNSVPASIKRYLMTKEQEAELEETLSKYVPYTDEELAKIQLDGYYDIDRMEAAKARIFLANKEIID